MKKKIISLFIALVLCFTFIVPFSVSADAFTFNIPETWYHSSSDSSVYNSVFTELKKNSEFKSFDKSYVFIKPYSTGYEFYIWSVPTDQFFLTLRPYSWADGYVFFSSDYYYGSCLSLDSISSIHFTHTSQVNSSSSTRLVYIPSSSIYINVNAYYNGSSVVLTAMFGDFSAGFYYDPVFVPSPSTLYGLDLSINETSFYDWIIENNKLSELPSYITQSKLLSFIQFYSNFGGSFSNFLKNIPDWFSHMNILNQSKENVNILKSSMDRLYQEYLDSFWREVGKGNSALLPHHRKNIQTQTTDDDTTLITDDSSDTVDTSILRDILRGIIQLSNQVAYGTTSIVDKLDKLNFTVNVANGGGSFSASEIWGSGDIAQSSNYQALSDAFVEHGVVISNVENLQYNYLAGQTQKDSFTVSVDMPDEYVNGEFTKKTITHTVDSNSKMYDTLVLFRKIIALAVILFYVVRLKLALPSLIKGE